jgi:hypothetical protein
MSSKAFRILPTPLCVSSEHVKSASILYKPDVITEVRGRRYFSEEQEDVERTELEEKRVGGHLTALRAL